MPAKAMPVLPRSETLVSPQSEPQARGTFSLVSGCLTTILLCTVSIQRLPVPPQHATTRSIYLRKLKWLFITLVSPEYVAWIAYDQWTTARETLPGFQDLGCGWWTLMHGFYAEMDGFVVSIRETALCPAAGTEAAAAAPAASGKDVERRLPVRSRNIQQLLRAGAITLPHVERESLVERSKTDTVAQLLTMGQVAWFTVKVLARRSSALPVTPLEVATLAFVACAVCIAFFWWRKPNDLARPTVITVSGDREGRFRAEHARLDFAPSEADMAERFRPRQFFARFVGWNAVRAKIVFLLAIGSVFNGIHCFAWNFEFPTAAEVALWRACSVVASVSLLAMYPFMFLPAGKRWYVLHLGLGFGVGATAYVAARVCLVVQMFACIRALPSGVYEDVEWLSFLPHWL